MTQNQNKQELIAAIEAAEALSQKYKYNKAAFYFPDTGKYSRDKYPRQMDLMRAGKTHRIRAFIGGNSSGKSLWLALEAYFHLSGKYPEWWQGHRFNEPIEAWLCGLDAKALRAGLQRILFGGIGKDDIGTGIIAREDLTADDKSLQVWSMGGTSNCIGQFRVRHYTNNEFDGWSTVEFMTYEQGWKAFQGPTKQFIGFDEEPDDGKVFAECIARLRGKDGGKPGHFLAAFTPTDGCRDVYLAFVPKGTYPTDGTHPDDPSKYTCRVGWSNSPHIDEEWKQSAIVNWKLTDPNNIEARTEGYAALGSGRIYPIDEASIVVSDIEIPSFWKRSYGLDPGWNYTAAIWIAEDPNTHVKYIYSEYQGSKQIDVVHAEAIKARGNWMRGGIDPHGAKHKRDDGTDKIDYFNSLGLDLVPASGDPITLRSMILGMFQTGALKILHGCQGLLDDIRIYRYDSNDPNKPARDQMDHRLDAMVYCIAKFDELATSYAEIEDEKYPTKRTYTDDNSRSDITGY